MLSVYKCISIAHSWRITHHLPIPDTFYSFGTISRRQCTQSQFQRHLVLVRHCHSHDDLREIIWIWRWSQQDKKSYMASVQSQAENSTRNYKTSGQRMTSPIVDFILLLTFRYRDVDTRHIVSLDLRHVVWSITYWFAWSWNRAPLLSCMRVSLTLAPRSISSSLIQIGYDQSVYLFGLRHTIIQISTFQDPPQDIPWIYLITPKS